MDTKPISLVFNCDNLEYMKTIPDNYFDLILADPEYGINIGNDARAGVKFKKSATIRKDYAKKDWDLTHPEEGFFKELFRISKNQIIWGVNFYPFPFFTGGRVFWNKNTAEGYTNGDGELAYCSLINSVKEVKITWNGMIQHDMKNKENRIHPTQKPIALYKWLLKNYAKEGNKIFDPNMGSQSSRIAAYDMGFDYWGCELDLDYFNDGNKRFENFKSQLRMF